MGPLLVDKSLSVRHSAAGALRDLSLVSEDVCDEMIAQDVMTPLCSLISMYSEGDWEKCQGISKVLQHRYNKRNLY